MSQYVPISAEQHASLRWRRYTSYEFAQQTHLAALVGAELAKAAMAMPIALVPRPGSPAPNQAPEQAPNQAPGQAHDQIEAPEQAPGQAPAQTEAPGEAPSQASEQAKSPDQRPAQAQAKPGYMLVALLGLEPGVNLFVAPDGRWLGRYVPAALRGHPFRLAHAEQDKLALCVDQDSGLIGQYGDEAFFDANGEVAEPVKQVMEFLTQIERNRAATEVLCDRLRDLGLIQTWPVKLQGGDGGERAIEGLYRIDEAALNALPVEQLAALRDAGGLSMAYCQLLSMQHLALLGELAQARTARAPKLDDVFSFPDEGVLHFGD